MSSGLPVGNALFVVSVASDMWLGFDYQFNAIGNGDNELLRAYKEMFEVGISQQNGNIRMVLSLYFPFLRPFLVSSSRFRCLVDRLILWS